MKQCKEECEIVMWKLTRIANIVVKVGKSCEKYNLNERDLPDGLRTILGSLQGFVNSMVVFFYDSYGVMNDQRAGWGRTRTEEVCEGQRHQRIPST